MSNFCKCNSSLRRNHDVIMAHVMLNYIRLRNTKKLIQIISILLYPVLDSTAHGGLPFSTHTSEPTARRKGFSTVDCSSQTIQSSAANEQTLSMVDMCSHLVSLIQTKASSKSLRSREFSFSKSLQETSDQNGQH